MRREFPEKPKGEMFAVRNRRLLLIFAALSLCLLLWAAAGYAEDATDQTGLIIQEASYDPAGGLLTVTWTNTGTIPAEWAELRVIPRDADGKQVIYGENAVEEILDGQRTRHVTVPAAPGETVTASVTVGGLYPSALSVDFAFDRIVWREEITAEDGTVQYRRTALDLPDRRLHWYSTARNAYISEPAGEAYTMPPEEILNPPEENRLGITAAAVTGELAGAYGYGWSGLLVTEVQEGSAAEAIGFEAGDLVFGMNDTLYENEPYILPLAVDALLRDETIVFLVERNGEAMTIVCGPDAE